MANQPRPQTKRKAAPSRKTVQPNNLKKSQKTNSTPIHMRIFYAFMLILIASGSFISILGRRQVTQASSLKIPTAVVANVKGISAKALTYHRQGDNASICDDLVVTVSGDAVLTACNNGGEKRYQLSATERQQLAAWLDTFKTTNFDSGTSATVYLNGHGAQVVAKADQQALLAFANILDAEISSHP